MQENIDCDMSQVGKKDFPALQSGGSCDSEEAIFELT